MLAGVVGLLLASGCGRSPAGQAERPLTPPQVDPSARGPGIALVQDLYPELARAANAFDRLDRSRDILDRFRAASERCREAIPVLSSAAPGESEDDARRRSLVLGGCVLMRQARADGPSIDRTLSLFALAVAPEGTRLPPAAERRE